MTATSAKSLRAAASTDSEARKSAAAIRLTSTRPSPSTCRPRERARPADQVGLSANRCHRQSSRVPCLKPSHMAIHEGSCAAAICSRFCSSMEVIGCKPPGSTAAASCPALHTAAIIMAVVDASDEAAPAGEDVGESTAKECARIAHTTPTDGIKRASAMRAKTAITVFPPCRASSRSERDAGPRARPGGRRWRRF